MRVGIDESGHQRRISEIDGPSASRDAHGGRWSDRDELVRAAIAHVLRESLLEVPDTGSLRDDLVSLMREIGTTRVRLITLVYGALAGYHRDVGEDLGELHDPAVTGRAEALDTIYDRAVRRGEIEPDRLTDRIKSLPFDLLRHEILLTFAPVPDAVIEEIVDTIFLPLVRPPGT